MNPKLEEVFKLAGVPTFTFVKPAEYAALTVAIRTPGRGVVVEGPSGIGKTTSIVNSIQELNWSSKVTRLSARKQEDRKLIAELSSMDKLGIVIVDDFHRLDASVKADLADFLKTLADEEVEDSKVVVVGINRAGDTLVQLSPDLNDRIATIKFQSSAAAQIADLISKGEDALNITIQAKEAIANESQGSFHLAQHLCHEACLFAGVTERGEETKQVSFSLETIRERVLERLGRTFGPLAQKFATGRRLRPEGRAPYLHLLYWLAQSDAGLVQMDDVLRDNPDLKASVLQVVEKGYLEEFLKDNTDLSDLIHYDPQTQILSVEDPKFIYYLRNIAWKKFSRKVGYVNTDFKSRYDFALSFAGADRTYAESLRDVLTENELHVFYDKDEQHRIAGSDVEEYLAPIYRSEADYVIVLLGTDYPNRIWTKFESEQFKERFGDDRVIPVVLSGTQIGAFDKVAETGYLSIDRAKPIAAETDVVAQTLIKKFREQRTESASAAATT